MSYSKLAKFMTAVHLENVLHWPTWRPLDQTDLTISLFIKSLVIFAKFISVMHFGKSQAYGKFVTFT